MASKGPGKGAKLGAPGKKNFGSRSDKQKIHKLIELRERQRLEVAERQKQIEADNKLNTTKITDKFSAYKNEIEDQIASSTVGLVTLKEMQTKQTKIVEDRDLRTMKDKAQKLEKEKRDKVNKEKMKILKRKKTLSKLSFGNDDDEDEEENSSDGSTTETEIIRKKKVARNQAADSSYLPNASKNEDELELRKQLREEWEDRQRIEKNKIFDIPFSYWDGTTHRFSVSMKQGNTIEQFILKGMNAAKGDHPELRGAGAEMLMFVKDDLIFPHYYTFHDFYVNKVISPTTGEVIDFEDADEQQAQKRTVMHFPHAQVETTVTSDKCGKLLLRSWYERNKHIFPASRWQAFDPVKMIGYSEGV